MQTEELVYAAIVGSAQDDENIRAVVLYGSRANPAASKDRYQDFDIYYVVRNTGKFADEHTGMDCLGTVDLVFRPDLIYRDLFPDTLAYLMLFDDGNRVDLSVCNLETFLGKLEGEYKGRPMRCLLDKDGCLPPLGVTDELVSRGSRPDANVYADTCAEFFWELQNVAKGIMRDELSYALFLRDVAVRDMLNRMVDWYIGIRTDFGVSVGTLGKYRKKYLDAGHYEVYRRTYSDACYENVWETVYTMLDLFGELGSAVAQEFGYTYPSDSEDKIRKHLGRVRTPSDTLVPSKTLVFICGANGIGKTTICKALLRHIDRSAYVDTDPCRTMNPSVLDDVTIPTIAKNISCLIRNYLLCPAVDTVIFSYGFHGRRREVFDGVLRDLAGLDYTFVPLLLVCEEAENVRRMQADARDAERIRRALEHSRPAYADVPYPRIDVTDLSPDEAVAAILSHLSGTRSATSPRP